MIQRTLIIIAIVLLSIGNAFGKTAVKNIEPDGTYMFEKRDTCDLFLDVYNPAKGSKTTYNGKAKPTIVFMFGGGFIHGTRNDESYNKWFSFKLAVK